jgi:hypothetical protein
MYYEWLPTEVMFPAGVATAAIPNEMIVFMILKNVIRVV